MCIAPITLKIENQLRTVPCSKCFECLKTKISHWQFRLEQELKVSTSAYFVTLTYDDEHMYYSEEFGTQSVNKRDVQLFLKRLRIAHKNKKIRYYLISEYGYTTYRPHYHMLLFNISTNKELAQNSILKNWGKGHIYIGSVNSKSIGYCCKYHITKGLTPIGHDPTFTLMSRNPGIGYLFYEKNKEFIKNADFIRKDNIKISVPKYYLDKLQTSKFIKDVKKQENDSNRRKRELKRESEFLDKYPHKNSVIYTKELDEQNAENNKKFKTTLKNRKL